MDHREIAFENIPVTEESIETVPHTDYFSEELNEKYRKINIELLKMVKNQDVGIEAAAICDESFNLIGDYVVGTYFSVKIPGAAVPHHVIHNHPSGETLNAKELLVLTKRKNMLSITALGNDGNIYCVIASPQSDPSGFAEYLEKRMNEVIFTYEDKPYSYKEILNGDLDLMQLNVFRESELEEIIYNFHEECAEESERYGYRYFRTLI